MNHRLKKVIGILAAVFAVSSLLCAISVAAAMSAVSAKAREREAYTPAWSFEMREGMSLSLDMYAADTIVEPYDGAAIEIAFDGTRPSTNKELPSIEAKVLNGTVVVRELYPGLRGGINFDLFMLSGSSAMQGTLTVRVPKGAALAGVDIAAYSGGIQVGEISMASLKLKSNSGLVAASGVKVSDALDAENYSGNIMIADVTCKTARVKATSGGIAVTGLESDALTSETYSGRQSISKANIRQRIAADTTAGAIALIDCQSNAVSVASYSGDVSMQNVRSEAHTVLKSTSGTVGAIDCGLGAVSLETYSGNASLDRVRMASLNAKTTSGSVSVNLTGAAGMLIETYSSNVTVSVDKGEGFSYAFTTYSGGASVEDGSGGPALTGGAMNGSIGGGGSVITVKTTSGNFKLAAR